VAKNNKIMNVEFKKYVNFEEINLGIHIDYYVGFCLEIHIVFFSFSLEVIDKKNI
tara:strand:+ start:1186 stop:1350 length:165 start_codon:yes stop_codon:yes gene_type:complete